MSLHADDLEPGLFVTVLRGHVEKSWRWGEEHVEEHDHRNGCALIVLAVSLPFVVVGILAGPNGERPAGDTRVTVDTRRVKLGRLSAEYVYALTREPIENLMPRFRDPNRAEKVRGIVEEEVTCERCGGPWPLHAKVCPHYRAPR